MEDFFERIKKINNPEIIERINSKNPYVICDLLEEIGGGEEYLKALEDAIIQTNDITQIYEFLFLAVDMNIKGFDRERFERTIRESKNSKLMCYCIGFVPGIDIQQMVKALIKTKNAKYMEILLTNEEYSEGLNEIINLVPEYEEEVEKAKQFDYYPESLKEFKGFKDDIGSLKEKIIATHDPYLITELANYIEYLNEYKEGRYSINDLTRVQEQLQDPMQTYEYLASVHIDDKKGLIESAIKSGRAKFIYYILTYVPGLTQEERKVLEESKKSIDPNGKYTKLIEDSVKDKGDL